MSSSSHHRIMTHLPKEGRPFFELTSHRMFVYQRGTDNEVKISLPVAPQTAEDYYELAVALRDHHEYKGRDVYLEGFCKNDKQLLSAMALLRKSAREYCEARIEQANQSYMLCMKGLYEEAAQKRELIEKNSEFSAETRARMNLDLINKLKISGEAAAAKEEREIRAAKDELNNALTRMDGAAELVLDFAHWGFQSPDGNTSLEEMFVREKNFINELFIYAVQLGFVKAAAELTFTKYNVVDGIIMYLPKPFRTADELERLAHDLKSKGGCDTYYFMEDNGQANTLSDRLLAIVAEMRKSEKKLAHPQESNRPTLPTSSSAPVISVRAQARFHAMFSEDSRWAWDEAGCKPAKPPGLSTSPTAPMLSTIHELR